MSVALNNAYGGFNNDLLGQLPITIPTSLKFPDPKQGPPGTRKVFRLSPVSSSYSTAQDNIVRFFLNNDGLADFTRGALFMAINITYTGGTTGTYLRLAQNADCIFNRARVSVGVELDDMREYNRLASFLWEIYRTPDAGDTDGPMYGYGTQAERNTWGATTTSYMLKFQEGMFLSGIIPLGLFNDRVMVELYLDNPTKFVETDYTGGNITVTLNNIYWHYEVLLLNGPTTTDLVANALQGVCYPFKSWTYFVQPVTGAVQDLLIPASFTGIDKFWNIIIQSDNWNAVATNDKFLTWLFSNCQTFQLKINNEFFPLEPVYSGQWAYQEFLKGINKWEFGGRYQDPPAVGYVQFHENKFVIVNNLQAYPRDKLVNNFSTNNGGNNVYQRLMLNSPPAVNSVMITFVENTKCINFQGRRLRLGGGNT
jgi:hypothetical protein